MSLELSFSLPPLTFDPGVMDVDTQRIHEELVQEFMADEYEKLEERFEKTKTDDFQEMPLAFWLASGDKHHASELSIYEDWLLHKLKQLISDLLSLFLPLPAFIPAY